MIEAYEPEQLLKTIQSEEANLRSKMGCSVLGP